MTPQRRFIFEALQDHVAHPTVEDIYRKVREVMPDISLATVYHTVKHLEELGEVVQLDLGEGKSRYDPCTDGHSHLVCVECRGVLDIVRDFEGLELLPEETSGYQVLRCDVAFYGYCPECQG